MTNTPTGSERNKVDRDSAVIISYLAKRKYKYLSISILTGIICAVLFKLYVLGYSSTGSFFVNDMNVLSSSNVDLKVVDNLTPNDNFNRIFQQTISSSVQNHLIKKFNLTKHYDVDSTKEFYIQRTGNILKSNISVKKNAFGTILVTVNDQYRYLAADMANEIMNYIDNMNREYYADNIQRKLKISEAFLLQMKKGNDAKERSVDSLLAEMHELTIQAKRSTTSSIYMLQLEQQLSELVNDLSNSTHDLMNSQKLYNLTLQALSQKDYKTITIVQSAMPAPKSNILQAIIYGALVSVALICLMVFRAYLKLEYTDHVRLLFNKPAKES